MRKRSSGVWLGAGFQAEKVDLNSGSLAVHPNDKPHPRYERPAFRLGFARLVTHYFRHQAWPEDGILRREANVARFIAGVLFGLLTS